MDTESKVEVLMSLSSCENVDPNYTIFTKWGVHNSKFKFHDLSLGLQHILFSDVQCLLAGTLINKGRSCCFRSFFFSQCLRKQIILHDIPLFTVLT